ncbi:MAG: pyridoxal phosphate-dependent aminotransferase [Lachnospiraceae bacterium]|nr:pyridoxal phosphate-dependent aminotransferase [Lachnospiraceae bacterium]
MQYNFDQIIDRRGSGSLKWNVGEKELPMWVADMDFQTAPAIIEAIQKKTESGIFGYQIIPDEWYTAYMDWWRKRHGFEIRKEWLVFCTGVVPAISSAVRKLTTPGENVLVQTPVYNIFFHSIRNNGRNVLENSLLLTDGEYRVDFEDLEEKLKNPQTSLMILCNPQNPSGKIWDRETLAGIGELCEKYQVTVLSDEIHCDLTEPGTDYIPFASVSDICRDISITCMSPSKTFNLAGMQSAAVCIPNKTLRHKVWRALNTDEVAEPNAFAVSSVVAAYQNGEEWLDALRVYLSENRRTVREYLSENLPELSLVKGDATYLLWLDAGKIKGSGKQMTQFIRRETGLYLSDGEPFGAPGFLRMNIACPRSVVLDGLERLQTGIRAYER